METVLQIQEGPYPQFFCGMSGYRDEAPFDASLMVQFRKRLTPEILGEINEMVIATAEARRKQRPPDDGDGAASGMADAGGEESGESALPNEGTLLLDATCAPVKMRYPTDTALLNEARENSERLIDSLHAQLGGPKPRTYREIAHKHYTSFARNRKPKRNNIRRCLRQQLSFLRRNLAHIKAMQEAGGSLLQREVDRLATLERVFVQQQGMYSSRTRSVPQRIVSVSQPHIRPIVRGKAKSPVEFGPKLDISSVNGMVRLEDLSFESYNESTNLQEAVRRFHTRTGRYPTRILADKIYRTRENLEHDIRLCGPALGRPHKDAERDRELEYRDACDRIEIERHIGLAKATCGLGLLTTRLPDTTASSVALSILATNLRAILRFLFLFRRALLLRWVSQAFCAA